MHAILAVLALACFRKCDWFFCGMSLRGNPKQVQPVTIFTVIFVCVFAANYANVNVALTCQNTSQVIYGISTMCLSNMFWFRSISKLFVKAVLTLAKFFAETSKKFHATPTWLPRAWIGQIFEFIKLVLFLKIYLEGGLPPSSRIVGSVLIPPHEQSQPGKWIWQTWKFDPQGHCPALADWAMQH